MHVMFFSERFHIPEVKCIMNAMVYALSRKLHCCPEQVVISVHFHLQPDGICTIRCEPKVRNMAFEHKSKKPRDEPRPHLKPLDFAFGKP